MIRLLLVFLLFSFFTHNSSGQGASIPQVIDTADFVITKNQSPFRIDKSIVVGQLYVYNNKRNRKVRG